MALGPVGQDAIYLSGGVTTCDMLRLHFKSENHD